MFKLGISSKALRDYDLLEAITLAKDIGYEAFELWVDDIVELDCSIDELKEYLINSGLIYSIHLHTEDFNIASFNEGIRSETIKQHSEAIVLASKLGVNKVTLHPGRKVAKSKTLEESWEIQLKSIKDLVKVAEQNKVMLCVENMEKIFGEYVVLESDIGKINEAIDSDYLGFTLDIAHLQTIGKAEELVKDIAYTVHHVHISQATEEKLHMPIYKAIDGCINYEIVLSYLKKYYDGVLIIEGYVKGKGEEVARESYSWFEAVALK